MHRYSVFALIGLSLVVGLGACSPSKRVTEPPVAQISGIELLMGGEVRVEMMLTNLNPVALLAQSAKLTLVSENIIWLETEQSIAWQVSANAREAVSITARVASPNIMPKLDDVSQGRQGSLPYALKLMLTLPDDRVIETEQTGFLYRVPGQLGRFR